MWTTSGTLTNLSHMCSLGIFSQVVPRGPAPPFSSKPTMGKGKAQYERSKSTGSSSKGKLKGVAKAKNSNRPDNSEDIHEAHGNGEGKWVWIDRSKGKGLSKGKSKDKGINKGKGKGKSKTPSTPLRPQEPPKWPGRIGLLNLCKSAIQCNELKDAEDYIDAILHSYEEQYANTTES